MSCPRSPGQRVTIPGCSAVERLLMFSRGTNIHGPRSPPGSMKCWLSCRMSFEAEAPAAWAFPGDDWRSAPRVVDPGRVAIATADRTKPVARARAPIRRDFKNRTATSGCVTRLRENRAEFRGRVGATRGRPSPRPVRQELPRHGDLHAVPLGVRFFLDVHGEVD